MDRMQRAKNLLIELEALKEADSTASPLGMTIILGITLTDAEILVREMLTEMNLREAMQQRARNRRPVLSFPGVRQAWSSVKTLRLRRPAHKDVLSGRFPLSAKS